MHCPAPRPRDASFHRFTGRLRRRLFSVLLLLNLANGLLQFASLDSQVSAPLTRHSAHSLPLSTATLPCWH